MDDGKCAICGGFIEGGICDRADMHPTTQAGFREMSFKQMMYRIVNEVEAEKRAQNGE